MKFYKPLFSIIVILVQLILSLIGHYEFIEGMEKMKRENPELYELIKDLKTKKEFEEEIKKRFQECEELFDEDTIALFIIDELGRNKQVIKKITDIQPDSDCTVVGKVTNIYESKNFKRKNGTSGKVINLDISDDTGTCRLVLWNKDVEQVKNKDIKRGTTVKIINGYTKQNRYFWLRFLACRMPRSTYPLRIKRKLEEL